MLPSPHKEATMAKYLFHGSYTVEGIKGVRKEGGTGRRQAVSALAQSVGGSLESFYFAFGGDDFYAVVDLPDNTRAAAVATAVAASGAVSLSTVVLLSPEDLDAASKVDVAYRAPGS
jgi:uncharacterized protein with GYD domain